MKDITLGTLATQYIYGFMFGSGFITAAFVFKAVFGVSIA